MIKKRVQLETGLKARLMNSTLYGTWMAKPLECGREAAALNNQNKEGGSFAAALQGALRAHCVTGSSFLPGAPGGGFDAESALQGTCLEFHFQLYP
jgi:hypothetical protein